MGAGMTGLVAARVLSDPYERVTVIERDTLPSIAESRKGVPLGSNALSNTRPTSCRDGTQAMESRDGDGGEGMLSLAP